MNSKTKNGNQNGRSTGPTNVGKKKRNGNGNGNGTLKALGLQGAGIPVSYAMANVRKVQNQKCRHSGSDFLTTVTVKADLTNPADRVLLEIPITPSGFPGTRLTQFSQLYEFYKFVSLRLRYVPAVPVTLACQLVLYVDLDPTDDPTAITNSDALIRQAIAQTGSQQWNFHTPKVIPMAMRADQQFYFTGDDRQNVRFTQQGKAYLIQVTQAVDVSGTPITTDIEAGSVFIDWTVDFNIPQINPESVSAFTPTQTNVTEQLAYINTDWTNNVWTPDWEGVLFPNSYYAATLYYSINPSAIGGSGLFRLTVGTDQYTDDVQSTTLVRRGGIAIITTNNRGIPTKTITITKSAVSASNSAGIAMAPLQPGGGFPAAAFRRNGIYRLPELEVGNVE